MNFFTNRKREAEEARQFEIHPELWQRRRDANRRENIIEALSFVGLLALGALAAVIWLALEGWL